MYRNNMVALSRIRFRRIVLLLALLWLATAPGTVLFAQPTTPSQAQFRFLPFVSKGPVRTFLPLMQQKRWDSPFGVEYYSIQPLSGPLSQHLVQLGSRMVRVNFRVSWRQLQPVEGGPIHWEQMREFEKELRTYRENHLIPIVVIQDSPRWATINQPFDSSCGAIRPDKLAAFATFAAAAATRYGTAGFNVQHWELGNEPDVDPTLVNPDSIFGCWGDRNDPFYGGRQYGEMLKVVTPAIKAATPSASVWLGGLLLAAPITITSDVGKPEQFFRGILEAGAAPYFDVLAYHAYAPYLTTQRVDHELVGPWAAWGGYAVGKARFLRGVMAEYGVSKPLYINEVGLMCPPYMPNCDQPNDNFLQAQANHAVRTLVRGLSEDIEGYAWFTLNDTGWRATGLLDGAGQTKPAYVAYQQLNRQLQFSSYLAPATYDAGVEGYIFQKQNGTQLQVVWTRDNVTIPITVPQARLVRATSRDGVPLTPLALGNDYLFTATFEPIYLVLRP